MVSISTFLRTTRRQTKKGKGYIAITAVALVEDERITITKRFNMTIVEMCVHMDCAGCESKIRKALQKLEGVDSVEIDMAKQKVTVTGYVEQKKVLKAVRRTGRRAVLWPYAYGSSTDQYTFSHQHHQHHPALAQAGGFGAPSSSYNYYKHGYDDSGIHGYYQMPPHAAGVIGERTGAMFSDENPNACSVM